MKSPLLLSLVLAVSAIPFTPSLAQPLQMDPMIVTATRIAQPASSLLSDVRVIDSVDLSNAGNQSLLEVLQAQGGVEIARNGGPGQVSGVFVRGTNANHVVILVDGVRINSATTGTNALENIPLNVIERIEIVRGPMSSLYGADAIGGAIQIFTRRERTTLSVGGGTWNTQRANGGIFREFGALKLSAQAGYEATRAFSATNERSTFSFNPDRDPYRNRNGALSAGYTFAPGHVLTLSTLVSDGAAHFDSGPASDDINRQRLSTYAVESSNRLSNEWTSRLRLARGTDDLKVEGSFPSRFRTDQDQFSWQNDITAPGGRAAAGVEYRKEKVDSSTAYSQSARSIRSLFGSYSGSLGMHLAQASLRHDDNSQFGGHTTGNASYGYRFTPAWRAYASYGTAFKAPSFNDLYFVSKFFSGNPLLKPERSTNYEGAVHYELGPMQASLTLYRNRVRELIAVDPTFTTVVNVNTAQIRGGTLRAATDLGGVRLKAEVTHEDATNQTTGTQLPRRARDFGSVSIAGQSGPWRYGAEMIASAKRYDSVSNAALSRLAGYALLNLRAGYAVTPAWSLNVRWNNVLDRDYELVRGYNTAGSNVFVSIDYASSP